MQRPVSVCEELSDTDLIALANQSDQRAFAALWKRHHAPLLLFARGIVRNDADALTQGYAQSRYPGAMRGAADLLAARSRKTYVTPFDVAGNYALAGEKTQALGWLEKALEMRDPNMPYVSVDPALDTLRNTPRFLDILRRMNLPR